MSKTNNTCVVIIFNKYIIKHNTVTIIDNVVI
jgi:hypothetical protein